MANDPQNGKQSKPATAARARNRQLANTNVKELLNEQRNFFDSHRGAMVSTPHTFYHPMIERMFRRNFDQMSQYLHFIPVMGRVLLEKEEDVQKIEVHVKNSIIKHTDAFNKLLRECEATYAIHELVAPRTMPNGYNVEVKLTSPLSRIFYELHDAADRFLMAMTDLWIRGLLHQDDFELNEKKRNEFELDVKRMMNTVMGTIQRQHRTILNRIRREQQNQNQATNTNSQKANSDVEADAAPVESAGIETIEDKPIPDAPVEVVKAA